MAVWRNGVRASEQTKQLSNLLTLITPIPAISGGNGAMISNAFENEREFESLLLRQFSLGC
jgi:hypothetical protein